jgi:hypothetical protein
MNPDSTSLDHRLLALLQAVRDTHDDAARATLNELLRNDSAARAAMARLMVDEQALIHRLRDDSIISLLNPAPSTEPAKVVRSPRWISWRPLTAAAAGLVIGMLCTSVGYGLAAHRADAARKVPLVVYNPSLENSETIAARSVPRGVGQWGANSAKVVSAENGVLPLQGQRMLRLEPIPLEKNVKNHSSCAFQVLDLGALPMLGSAGDAEVQVTASFFAANSDVASRYFIRAIALDEAPAQATQGFWPKTQDDGVVSTSQRFDTAPGDRRWHTFSLKMPLPRGAQTLVFVLGAEPTANASAEASPHYLDEVHVSLVIPQTTLP